MKKPFFDHLKELNLRFLFSISFYFQENRIINLSKGR